MQKAGKSDVEEILSYIGKDIKRCLYMYADITVYGLDCPHLDLWFDRDGEGICRVVMRYHQSIQLYADRDFQNVAPILELVESHRPDGISGRRELIEALAPALSEQYHADYGVVFKGQQGDIGKLERGLADCSVEVHRATAADAADIAKLICTDPELGSVYTEESFAEEIRERIGSGMGRSYIIRDDGRVVAHNATYAETDRFVVISGLMVHPDYRDTEYARYVCLKTDYDIAREGKEYYFLALKRRIIHYNEFIGNHIVAEYGKLSRKQKSC